MTPPLLRARALRRTYAGPGGSTSALDGVDLDLAAGEILAVQGPSGSGKSTLLHILGLLDAPTSGTLAILGEDASALSSSRAAHLRRGTIGFVFQFFHLIPELTLLENVALPARLAGPSLGAARARAAALLADLGLSAQAARRPGRVSGGEMQRAAFARALVNDPPIVLCDEPTGNLDRANRSALIDAIRRARDGSRRAFVLATHDDDLAAIADRRLVLHHGRVEPAPRS